MDNANNGGRQQQDSPTGPNQWNDQNQVVNEQEQNRSINTGDAEFKENVASRTPEESPRDLNLNDSYDKTARESEGGAEIETPHKLEGDDEESTERKLPKM